MSVDSLQSYDPYVQPFPTQHIIEKSVQRTRTVQEIAFLIVRVVCWTIAAISAMFGLYSFWKRSQELWTRGDIREVLDVKKPVYSTRNKKIQQIASLDQEHPTLLTAITPRNFTSHINWIITSYYKKPFGEQARYKEDQIQGVARSFHGSMHACRTTIWALMLIGLIKKKAEWIEDRDVYFISIAAALHDSGRKDGGADFWDEESGENAKQYLGSFSKDLLTLEKVKQSISEKGKKGNKTLYQKIVHDADCLEVMRCRTHFEKKRLDLFDWIPEKVIKDVSDFVKETEQPKVKMELELCKEPLLYILHKLQAGNYQDICKLIAFAIKGKQGDCLVEGFTRVSFSHK